MDAWRGNLEVQERILAIEWRYRSKTDRATLIRYRRSLLGALRAGGDLSKLPWVQCPRATKWYRKYLDKTVVCVIQRTTKDVLGYDTTEWFTWDGDPTHQPEWTAKAKPFSTRDQAQARKYASLYQGAIVHKLVTYTFNPNEVKHT